MVEIDRARATATLRRSSPLFVLAVGFLLGVLVAVAVVPDRAATTTQTAGDAAGGAQGESATGDNTVATGTEAGGAGDAAGVGTAGGASGSGSTASRAASGGTTTGGRSATTIPGVPGLEPAAQRGVTAQKIHLGIGLPDISVIAALGPGYDQGDIRAHVESVLAAWRRDKKVPVAGRDIEVSYRTYNILSQDEQRAACVGFGQDDKVFAVVAIHDFGIGASECVSCEYRMPLVTADGPFDVSYRRGWPYLFTMAMSSSRVLRNFIAWGDQTGRFKGKRIGVYYPNDPLYAPDVQAFVIKRLRALGYQVVSEVTTDLQGAQTGGPNDSVAVQRFRTARVDTAILLVSPVAKTNFFNQAQLQGYRPMYLENDLAFSTTTTATKTYPPDYFDGMVGVTGQRFGESPAGIPPTPEAKECLAEFKAATGKTVDRDAREAEYIAGNQACDELRVLMSALQWAGRNLTPARLVAGLETLKRAEMGIHGDVTFSSNKHDGVSAYRELLWKKGCKCWVAQGAFKPLAGP
jgi:hypothetical protein